MRTLREFKIRAKRPAYKDEGGCCCRHEAGVDGSDLEAGNGSWVSVELGRNDESKLVSLVSGLY